MLDLKKYFEEYKRILAQDSVNDKIEEAKELLMASHAKGNTAFIQGNGASAAIASHCALDFTKQAKIKTLSFNESSLITAYANDFGYENWVLEALCSYASEGDVALLISSSGKSANIVNAASYCRDNGINVITFSGFSRNNPLIKNGDINFWVDSKAYNIIECIHMIWITAIIDSIIGKSEYSVS